MYLKRFSKSLKNQDMFGHVITLNFKSKGETYPTCIGGVFSILIYIGMTFYVGWNVKKLVKMEQDTLSTQSSSLNLTISGEVDRKDT